AEDGIRDRNVTGVQTCALPILAARKAGTSSRGPLRWRPVRGGRPYGSDDAEYAVRHVSICGWDRAPLRLAKLVQRSSRGSGRVQDRKSTRLNSSHVSISYAVFC